MVWEVTWKPEVTALGVDRIPREEAMLEEREVVVVCGFTSHLVNCGADVLDVVWFIGSDGALECG